MTAPYPRRDWQQRADRALGRTSRGSQQGRFSGTRPVINSPVGQPEGHVDQRDVGELHKIDEREVVDDTTATFTLTYPPLPGSWNVSMGWTFGEDRYTISDRTLTVLDPADTFRGVVANGPRNLRVQYDYLLAAAFTEAVFPQSSDAGEQVGGSPTVTFDTAPTFGSSVIFVYRSKFGANVTFVSGLGATWTAISNINGINVWIGTGCNGIDTVVTTSGDCFWIGVAEVSTPLTATGAQVTVSTAGGNLASLTSTSNGVCVSVNRNGAGLDNTPAAGSWTQVGNGDGTGATLRSLVTASSSAEALDVHTNGVSAWDYAVIAQIPYA